MDIFQGHTHCANWRDRPHVSFDADKHENTVSVHFATQTCAEAAQQRLNINSLTPSALLGARSIKPNLRRNASYLADKDGMSGICNGVKAANELAVIVAVALATLSEPMRVIQLDCVTTKVTIMRAPDASS